jgi:hypothetical protein
LSIGLSPGAPGNRHGARAPQALIGRPPHEPAHDAAARRRKLIIAEGIVYGRAHMVKGSAVVFRRCPQV